MGDRNWSFSMLLLFLTFFSPSLCFWGAISNFFEKDVGGFFEDAGKTIKNTRRHVYNTVAKTPVPGNCKTQSFYCPDGKVVEYVSDWHWRELSCKFRGDLNNLLKQKCDRYACLQSESKYLGRADG